MQKMVSRPDSNQRLTPVECGFCQYPTRDLVAGSGNDPAMTGYEPVRDNLPPTRCDLYCNVVLLVGFEPTILAAQVFKT